MKKNKIALSIFCIFVIIVLLAIGIKFFPFFSQVSESCQQILSSTAQINSLLFLSIPIVFLLSILSIITFRVLGIILLARKFAHSKQAKSNRKTYLLLQRLDVIKKTQIVGSRKSFAFCLGITSTRIYVSTALIDKLSTKELEAVLLHEKHHLESKDALILTISTIIQSVFPFFPILQDFVRKFRIDREINADSFAVERMGNNKPLISALRKMLTEPSVVVGAGIAHSYTIEPRIQKLLHRKSPRLFISVPKLFLSVMSLGVLAFFCIAPIQAKELDINGNRTVALCTKDECYQMCSSRETVNASRPYSSVE